MKLKNSIREHLLVIFNLECCQLYASYIFSKHSLNLFGLDVVGILVKIMGVTTAKSGKKYREIFIVDESEETVSVFLWDSDAEEFEGCPNVPIGVRGALVRQQNNENVLNVTVKTTIEVF